MIDLIGTAIVTALEELAMFKAVEETVNRTVLQSPPGAAVILAYDKEAENKPVARELGWDIVLLLPALGRDRGKDQRGSIIDAVRKKFIGWRPFTTGGAMPARVPAIRLEGIEKSLLVYTVRLTMEVMPDVIDN